MRKTKLFNFPENISQILIWHWQRHGVVEFTLVYACVCEPNGGRLNSLQAICVNLASGARKTTYALPLNSRGMVIARFRKNNLCCWICRFIYFFNSFGFWRGVAKISFPKDAFQVFQIVSLLAKMCFWVLDVFK